MFARLARLVTRYPVQVILVWVALVLLAIPAARLAPQSLVANASDVKSSEAQKVTQIFTEQFALPWVDRTVLVSESSLPESDPRFRQVYHQLMARIEGLEGVVRLHRYDAESPLQQQSPDGRMTATLLDTRLENGEAVIEALRREAKAVQTPEIRFYVTGATAVTKDFLHLLEADVKRSELMALPLTGLVLLLAFGALVATGLPLMVGVVAITTGLACLFLLAQFGEVSSFALSVITMLSLGAGIDYALLMVNRFREELASGRSAQAAAAITTQTAGRTVAFSGLVVAIAMGAMLVPDLTFIRSMGVGGVMSITLTVLASITLPPAILSLLGERVNSPRRLAFKPTSSGRMSPFWGRWAGGVMQRPWMWAFGVAGLLLALAWPATQMKLGYTGAFGLGPNVESRKGLELIRQMGLGGTLDAFEILLDLGEEGFTPKNRARWRDLEQRLSAWPEVRLVVSPFLAGRLSGQGGFAELVGLSSQYVSQNRRYLRLTVIPHDAVQAPRIPEWYARLKQEAQNAGFEQVLLGGAPVGSMEFTQALVGAMPLSIGTVFVATFLLLAVAFRSLLIPLKSILMNTLTVGAAYGLITLIFQEGLGAGLVGAPTDVGGIDSSLPILLFAVIFGLSMDYEIFLLSRVQEAYLAGLDTPQAVRYALKRTAGVITSAALIMIIVFSAFVFGQVVANKTIGLGLAVAVLLDATLVRLVLVPAVLVLAGRWNWWLPEPLCRMMPKISLES
jgi:RND superfamily putative drug exporter